MCLNPQTPVVFCHKTKVTNVSYFMHRDQSLTKTLLIFFFFYCSLQFKSLGTEGATLSLQPQRCARRPCSCGAPRPQDALLIHSRRNNLTPVVSCQAAINPGVWARVDVGARGCSLQTHTQTGSSGGVWCRDRFLRAPPPLSDAQPAERRWNEPPDGTHLWNRAVRRMPYLSGAAVLLLCLVVSGECWKHGHRVRRWTGTAETQKHST